jgi:hypothetical protein
VSSKSYSEPAVLWRLRHRNGSSARATLIPGVPTSTLVFFVDDRFERGESVEDWEPALKRADEVKRALVEEGWEEEPEPMNG